MLRSRKARTRRRERLWYQRHPVKVWRLLTIEQVKAEFPIPPAIVDEWFEAALKGGLFLRGKLWPLGYRGHLFVSEFDVLELVAARNEPRAHEVWRVPRESIHRHVAPHPQLPEELG